MEIKIPKSTKQVGARCNRNSYKFLHAHAQTTSSYSNTALVNKTRGKETRITEYYQSSLSKICKDWANGNCKNGNQCQNMHSWYDGFLLHFQEDNPKPIRLVWWTSPPNNFVKINCDGAFTSGGNKAAAGGVVRDWNGKFIIGFSSALGNCSTVLEAELRAIKIGIETAMSRGFKNLFVESDSYAAIDLITYGLRQNHPYHALVSSILRMGDKTNHILWSHVFREVNSVADSLAKHGLSLSPTLGVKLFDFPPQFILISLCVDKTGIVYSR